MSQNQPADIKQKINPRVPVVGPGGQFKEPRCGPHPSSHGGACIAMYSAQLGGVHIFKAAKDEGWDLYEDVCNGEYTPINGGEPIAAPEYFEKWKRAAELREDDEDGQVTNRLSSIPDDFYHPEVYARRAAYRNGSRMINLSAELGGSKPKGGTGRSRRSDA